MPIMNRGAGSISLHDSYALVFTPMTKDKFLRIYANLPAPERGQVIAIIEGKTYSWDVAFQEISNDTELGRKILKYLQQLGIL